EESPEEDVVEEAESTPAEELSTYGTIFGEEVRSKKGPNMQINLLPRYLKREEKESRIDNFMMKYGIYVGATVGAIITMIGATFATNRAMRNKDSETVPKSEYEIVFNEKETLKEENVALKEENKGLKKAKQSLESAIESEKKRLLALSTNSDAIEDELNKLRKRPLKEEFEKSLTEIKIRYEEQARLAGAKSKETEEYKTKLAELNHLHGRFLHKLAGKAEKKESLEYFKKAKPFFEQSVALRGEHIDYNWLGGTHFNLGVILEDKEEKIKNWETAKQLLEKTKELRGNANDHYYFGAILSRLETVREGKKKIETCKEAIYNLEKAISQLGDKKAKWLGSAYSHLRLTLVSLGDSLADPNERIQAYQRAVDPIRRLMKNDKSYYDNLSSNLNKIIKVAASLKENSKKLEVYQSVWPHAKELIGLRGNDDDFKLLENNLSRIVRASGEDYDSINRALSDFIKFGMNFEHNLFFKGSKRVKTCQIALSHIKELIKRRGSNDDYKLASTILSDFFEQGKLPVLGDLELIHLILSDFVRFSEGLSYSKEVNMHKITMPYVRDLLHLRRKSQDYELAERALSGFVKASRSNYDSINKELSEFVELSKKYAIKIKPKNHKIKTIDMVVPHIKKLIKDRGGYAVDYKLAKRALSVIVQEGLDTKDYRLIQKKLSDFSEFDRRLMPDCLEELTKDAEDIPDGYKFGTEGYSYWLGRTFLTLGEKKNGNEQVELYVRAASLLEKSLKKIDTSISILKKGTRTTDFYNLVKDEKRVSNWFYQTKRKLIEIDHEKIIEIGKEKEETEKDLAINCYRFLTVINHDSFESLYRLGKLYYEKKDFDNAERYLRAAHGTILGMTPHQRDSIKPEIRALLKNIEEKK
ncbi:hypothetical protein KY342_03020, partial [Candidatus Woesearchaeota archaeon]|nr:hypothetical protein [Candidatus Woesearchaeota archaeon]